MTHTVVDGTTAGSADVDMRAHSRSAMHRLGIIYNAHSGRHQRVLADQPLPIGVVTQHARTFDEIGEAVKNMAEAGVTLLAVAGGDGTVRNVLTHVLLGRYFRSAPLIAIVASGSTNMTGADVGVVNLRRHGWTGLADWAHDGRDDAAGIRKRAVLRIDNGHNASPFCGMFFGAGAIHHAVEYTQSHLHSAGLRGGVGPAVAFGRFIKALAVGDRRHFKAIDLDARDDAGRALDQSTLLFAASTLDRLVLGFYPFWGERSAALRWTAVADNAGGLLRRLPGVAWGRPGRGVTPDNGYRSHAADEIVLSFDGGFVVDGECYAATRDGGPVVLSSAGIVRFLELR